MGLKLRGVVTCDEYEYHEKCEAKEEVLCVVLMRDIAGDVVQDVSPELPEGWTGFQTTECGQFLCPKHSAKRAR